MFSDTHFHLAYLAEQGVDLPQVFRQLAERNCAFALDIGTKCDDLPHRLTLAERIIQEAGDAKNRAALMLHFSAGIWPGVDAIQDRAAQTAALKSHVSAELSQVCAVGECGLDHHWNPGGADGRNENDFDAQIIRGEAELFETQLELARAFEFPVIVHSRDAFDGTFSCIKNLSYDNGVIHCFSYGIDEARAFLERGWYISFSGGITYTKKSRLEDMKKLLAFVPKDRLLLETDAPYLSPVPFRGAMNTPVLVEQVYRFASDLLQIDAETLSDLVDRNADKLFCQFFDKKNAD
ncbi:MAG: TatD family hydrolase [Treponema sp.]|jgi:TatD DNase family protein|nr:TatD family hydrolase [Treponema sp.]